MRNPVHILVQNEDVPLDAIKQFYVDVEREEYKMDTICDIYEVFFLFKGINLISSSSFNVVICIVSFCGAVDYLL